MDKYTAFSLFIRQCLLYPLASPFLPPEDKVQSGFSYANNQKTGSFSGGEEMPSVVGNNGELVIDLPSGIYNNKTATAVDSNLIADNIKSGVSIFGVPGNAVVLPPTLIWSSGSVYPVYIGNVQAYLDYLDIDGVTVLEYPAYYWRLPTGIEVLSAVINANFPYGSAYPSAFTDNYYYLSSNADYANNRMSALVSGYSVAFSVAYNDCSPRGVRV